MTLKIVIVLLVAFILVGIVAGFVYYKNQNNHYRGFNGMRMMNLSQSQIDAVNLFFSSTTNTDEINAYCMNNRAECFYYCRNNPNNDYCVSFVNYTRMMNYSRMGGRMWNQSSN